MNRIIDYINQRITNIEKKYCLCEILREGDKRFPAEYQTNGEYEAIEYDNYSSVVYHRLRGEITTEELEESDVSCETLVRKNYPMRLVAYVERSQVNSDQKLSQTIENLIRFRNSATLNTTLQTNSVSVIIRSSDTDRYSVWEEENSGNMPVDFTHSLIAIDYDIELVANDSCMLDYDCGGDADINPCGDCYAEIDDNGDTILVRAGESYTCVGNCEDVTVSNSDDTYSQTVAAGGALELADYTIKTYLDGVLSDTQTSPAMTNVTINITLT